MGHRERLKQNKRSLQTRIFAIAVPQGDAPILWAARGIARTGLTEDVPIRTFGLPMHTADRVRCLNSDRFQVLKVCYDVLPWTASRLGMRTQRRWWVPDV